MRIAVTSLYKIACKLAQKAFFLNQDDIDYFIEHNIISPNKVLFLPSEGIDCNCFKRKTNYPENLNFYFIGRLLKDKGVETFSQSAQAITAEFPDAHFNILGPYDPEKANSIDKSFFSQLKKHDNITYLGETDDVKPYLEQATCLIFPSHYEGAPKILMEAASMEIPIITTDVAGCRDMIIPGETGYLTEVSNTGELTEKIRTFINLPYETRREMGRKGREYVCKRFSIDKVISLYMKELETYNN